MAQTDHVVRLICHTEDQVRQVYDELENDGNKDRAVRYFSLTGENKRFKFFVVQVTNSVIEGFAFWFELHKGNHVIDMNDFATVTEALMWNKLTN